jgi:hypothetical protein
LQIGITANAALSGLTIAKGFAAEGGGIANYGTLTLTNATLSGNSADSNNVAARGGGIYNGGNLTLTNVNLLNNSAYSFDYGGFGGGIFNKSSATLTLTNATLSGNRAYYYGGGIVNNGTLTMTNSTVSGSYAQDSGGIANSGTMTLTNSTLAGNYAYFGSGGIGNNGTLTITNSTISGNGTPRDGGAIGNNGTLTLTNSTLSGNYAQDSGGGIYNGPHGMATLTNSTLSGNYAYYGGGIANFGTLTLTNSTLSGNSAAFLGVRGGGIANYGTSPLTLNNTLVAGNTAQGTGPDVFGTVVNTSGFNLIGDGTGMTGISNGVNGNQVGTSSVPINPMLSPLAFWGGPTETMPPMAGSPALDQGSNALAAGLTTDQRGGFRIANGTVDVGATEFQQSVLVNSTTDNNVADNVLTLREALAYLTGTLGRSLTQPSRPRSSSATRAPPE